MNRSLASAIVLSMALTGGCLGVAEAFTTVTPSTTAPVGLEQKFIAETTTQFNASLFVNPLAPNTYQIKLLGPGEPVTVIGNSLDDCISVGAMDGMDNERAADLLLMQNLQWVDLSSGTCAGVVVSSSVATACQQVYNVIGNAIAQRWNVIYSSTGINVSP